MTIVRRRTSTVTVLVALLLAVTLLVEKPARAQAGWEWGIPIVNMPASWWSYMGATASGATIWASPLGVASGGGTATATASGTAGVVAQGGTALAAGQAAVAGGIGIGLGWGAYEAGLWKWAGCDHVLNTGSSACTDDEGEPLDPVPGSQTVGPAATTMVVVSGSVTVTDWTIAQGCAEWVWLNPGCGALSVYQTNPGGANASTVAVTHEGLPDPGPNSGDRYYVIEECDSGLLLQQGSLQSNSSAIGPGTVNLTPDTSFGCEYTGRDGYEASGTRSVGVYDCDLGCSSTPRIDEPAFVAYPEGSPAPGGVTGGEGYDEDRRIEVRVECTDYGDPAEPTMTDTVTTDAYAPGEEVDIPAGSCPDGWTLTDYQAVRTVDGDPAADEVLFSHPGPDGLSAADPEAECYDGSCEVMIWRVIDGQPQTCDSEHVNCIGWMDAYKIDPTEWQCLWGGEHVLPISDCEMYEHIDEATYAGPDVVDEAEAEPETGDQTGTSTNPTHVEDGCGGSWLTPFTSIAAGVGCAVQWAFVPSEATMAEVETVRESMATKPPLSYASAVGEWFGAFGSIGEECWIIEHHNSFGTLDVMNSCDQSNGMVAWMTSHRGLLNIIVWLLFLTPFAWWAWAQYAPGSQGDA